MDKTLDPDTDYSPRPGTTPEDEEAALAVVYRWLLIGDRKRAAAHSDPDDAKGSEHDRATKSIHEHDGDHAV